MLLTNRDLVKLHLGCGYHYLEGWANIDGQKTDATDEVKNLENVFGWRDKESVDFIFSNAFFEHLWKQSQKNHLASVRYLLKKEGVLLYMGIPYFPEIAHCYLEELPPTQPGESKFNLYNAYRYTHGDPDLGDMYQIHKSLFDEYNVTDLLRQVEFSNYFIFIYGHPKDATPHRVTMGFCAGDSYISQEDFVSYLEYFQEREMILNNTVLILRTDNPMPQ